MCLVTSLEAQLHFEGTGSTIQLGCERFSQHEPVLQHHLLAPSVRYGAVPSEKCTDFQSDGHLPAPESYEDETSEDEETLLDRSA